MIEHKIWIAAPAQHVWQAITDPVQLEKWYAPGCPWEFSALKVGATVKFFNTETDIQHGIIEVIDPPHRFTIRWQPDQSFPEAELVNTFRLDEENGGTRVTITSSGYETLPEEMRQAWFDADNGAYTTIAENLKTHLEGEHNLTQ